LLALIVLLAGSLADASAQENVIFRPRARTLLQNARELYGRGEYEKAAEEYQKAQAVAKDLTPAEVKDLNDQIRLNTEALRNRREGSAQIQAAAEALRLGKVQEASSLLKGAAFNQFLSHSDRQLMAQLNQQVRNGNQIIRVDQRGVPGGRDEATRLTASRAGTFLREGRLLLSKGDYLGATNKAGDAEKLNAVYMAGDDTPYQLYIDIDKARRSGIKPAAPPVKAAAPADPRSLLTAARTALQHGELDKAEDLAHQAEKANTSWLPHAPWSDTPAKVLRDVQAARAKQTAPPPPPAPSQTSSTGSPFKTVKSLFSRGNPKEGDPKKPEDQSTPDGAGGEGPLLPPPPKSGPTSMNRAAPAAVARETFRGSGPEDRTTAARRLVHEGYECLHNNDIENARKRADEARALHANLNWWEDNPDKLLADIQRKAPQAVAAAAGKEKEPEPTTRPGGAKADPRVVLRDGRALLHDGKLEEAEKACTRAGSMTTSWGLFEDSPEKLRQDIQKERARHDREDSVKILADARKFYVQGQYQEAKAKAWRAQQLHGPYSIWDLGDRPQKLLAEIERAEGDQRLARKAAAPTAVAELRPGPPAPGAPAPPAWQPTPAAMAQGVTGPAPVPVADMVAKQRAQALLAEARVYQSRGQLIEARQRALEAQRAAAESPRPGLLFGPEEDRPETALVQLASLCDAHINNLLQHAGDCATGSAGDPQRFQKAQADLAQARQLALAFGQDTGRIDHKAAWLLEMQATSAVAQGTQPVPADPLLRPAPGATPGPSVAQAPGVAQVVNQEPPNKGKDLLERARLELKSGQTAMARRLAVAAYEPGLGVQKEALELLRSIDAEEYNQARLAANRSADAGFEAFQHHDYRQAANIFRSLNEDFLDPEKRLRLKEVSALPEMQPTRVAAAGPVKLNPAEFKAPADVPGTASVSDGMSSPREVASTDNFDRFKALEEIQFQQLRDDSLRVQGEALERFKAGDTAAAMDMLRDFKARLDDAQLNPDKVALLRRPIESRMQQWRTLKAQREFEKEQTAGLANANDSEHIRLSEKQKRDAEVADLMKQFRTLYHEGKYTQAEMVAQRAHDVDPDNVATDAALRMVEMAEGIHRAEEISRKKRKTFMDGLDDDPGPSLTMGKPVAFSEDKDYAARVGKRTGFTSLQAPTHNPIEQSIERKLMSPIPPVNFKDVPLKQAIEDLGTLSNGVNFYTDTAALNAAGVNLEQPLSLKVENISLKSALNLLLKQAKLTYLIKDEVLQITTEDEARGKLKQVTYPVADLVIPPSDGTLPNTSNFQSALERQGNAQGMLNQGPSPYMAPTSMSGGQPVGMSTSSMSSGGSRNFPGSPQAATLRPGQSIEDLLIKVITTSVAPDSWTDVGGKGTIQYFPIGLALVVNQTQDIQEQISDLLTALRRLQELEVAIEMRLITVSEAFYEQIGVNFDINIQNNSARFGPQLVSQQFQQIGQINNFSPNGFVSGLTPAGTFTPDLSIPIKNSSFQFSNPPFGGFPGTLGMDGGLSVGLAFLSEIQVFMFLEAAQVDRRTNVMQAPKLTVFNGQTANIQVQDQQFFLTGVQLVQAGAQIFFVPNQQPFPLGVSLQVTPVVSADRRFVRVNLQPSLTNLASTNVPLIPVQIPVPQLFEGPGTGTTSGGQPVIFQMFFQQPTFTQISLNTTVSVPDGGTVLLGGLKTLSEGRVEAGPPILSKIPYINRLFRNTAYGRESQSLLIMVTPRIIINEEEEQIFLGNIPPIPRDQ
jgi:type II secretory pathway component GspD/PulD (secretin)